MILYGNLGLFKPKPMSKNQKRDAQLEKLMNFTLSTKIDDMMDRLYKIRKQWKRSQHGQNSSNKVRKM